MLPVLALLMVVCTFAGVLVIDLGLLYDSRASAHAAADLAALAAVQQLPDEDAAMDTGLEQAKRNGFDDDAPGVEVTVEVDGVPCAHPNSCVRVTIQREFEWTFGRLLALTTAAVRSSAIAEQGRQPRDIIVIVDRSDSLDPEWEDYGQELFGFAQSVKALRPDDRLGLVTFPGGGGSGSDLALPLTASFGLPGPDQFDVALAALLSGSSNSNPVPALNAALKEYKDHARPGAELMIVFMSDGEFNGSTQSDIDAHVNAAAAAGIATQVVGVGTNWTIDSAPEVRLIAIARGTGGGYYAAPDESDVGDQLGVLARLLGIELAQ